MSLAPPHAPIPSRTISIFSTIAAPKSHLSHPRTSIHLHDSDAIIRGISGQFEPVLHADPELDSLLSKLRNEQQMHDSLRQRGEKAESSRRKAKRHGESRKRRNQSTIPSPPKHRRTDAAPGPTDYSPLKYDEFVKVQGGKGGAIAHFGTAARFETIRRSNSGEESTHSSSSTHLTTAPAFLANLDYSVNQTQPARQYTPHHKAKLAAYHKTFRNKSVFSHLIESQFAKFGWGKVRGPRQRRRIQPDVPHVAASQKYIFTDESIQRKYAFLNRDSDEDAATFEDWNPYSAQSAYSKRSVEQYGRVSSRGGAASVANNSRPSSAASSARAHTSLGFVGRSASYAASIQSSGSGTSRSGAVSVKLERTVPDRHKGPLKRPQSASSSQYYKQVTIPQAPRW